MFDTVTPSTKKDCNTMFHHTPTSGTTAAEDHHYTDCFEIGQTHWESFCRTPTGKTLLGNIPSEEHLMRAHGLFLFGFTAGNLLCPPTGKPVIDLMFAPFHGGLIWAGYLRTCRGEIVLDGDAYPRTPPTVLLTAHRFFFEGFLAGHCRAPTSKH